MLENALIGSTKNMTPKREKIRSNDFLFESIGCNVLVLKSHIVDIKRAKPCAADIKHWGRDIDAKDTPFIAHSMRYLDRRRSAAAPHIQHRVLQLDIT